MDITNHLLTWYDTQKRTFIFRDTGDVYRVWISEIMLQQTGTGAVIPYFERFLARFPDVETLAGADESEVLKLWEGLGYYSRARNLHKAAGIIVKEGFPRSAHAWLKIPGVGRYTANAIASIAFDEPVPAMDGNLQRVIARLYHITANADTPDTVKQLYTLGEKLMPATRAGDMNQALMDLGATVCLPGTPDCQRCPLTSFCLSFKEDDADALPRRDKKKPPKEAGLHVALVFSRDRVLMTKRHEALLKNMYVFLLSDSGFPALREQLAARGAQHVSELKKARHVFTHRVWNMTIHHFVAAEEFSVPHGTWVTMEEMLSLPIPTAMRAAKGCAANILQNS
ncbi:MAG: A/G-specific adenine glycosylase [Eubacteriales bacterium]|nr:A/G-specific adenine glycosylase [Eubacteriales bacterium]